MNRAKTKFLLDHDLTYSPWYGRQSVEQLYRWYDAIAYNPQWSGVEYSMELDEMWVFDEDDPNLVPKDMVWHDPDIDQIDLTMYDDPPGDTDYVKIGASRRISTNGK